MPDNKLSVEDILSELQMNRARTQRKTAPPAGDMQRIDEVIREILTQKQEAKLKEQNRTPTEAEWADLKKEIEAQTKTLTRQFEQRQMRREDLDDLVSSAPAPPAWERAARPAPAEDEREPAAAARPVPPREELSPPTPPPKREADGEAAPPRRRRPFPERPYPGLEHKGEADDEEQFDDLQEHKKASSQHIRENITGHFGNFKMDDVSVEDVYLKTEITPSNYKEYKSNRNKKIDSFVLGGGDAPNAAGEAAEQKPAPEREAAGPPADPFPQEPRLSLPADQDEYTSSSQADAVWEELRGFRDSCKTALVALGAVSLNAVLLSLVKAEEGGIWLFGQFAVTPFLYALVNFVLLAAALLVARGIFHSALDGLTRGVPTKDLFYAAAATACLLVNAVFLIWPGALAAGRAQLFTPIAVVMLFFAYVAKYQTARRALDNFKFVADGAGGYVVKTIENQSVAQNMTKGLFDGEPVLAGNIKTAFVENFMARSFQYDASDRLLRLALFAALPVSLLLGGGGWFWTKDVFTGLSLFSGSLAAAAGFLGAVLVTLPLHDTSALLVNHFGGMMPDYTSIEEYRNVNSVLLEGVALFPREAVSLHSIKTFQGKRVDDAILDGSSLCCAANSALAGMFLTIIGERREILRPVDSIQYEDLMGMSAWVDERRVLLGNRDLMVNHSIAVPKPEYEAKYRAEGGEVIYLAAEGELCAAFIVEFRAEPSAADVVRLLEKNRLAAVIRSMDASLTPELLGRVFETDPQRFKVLPSRLHAEYEAQLSPRPSLDSMLGNDGTAFGCVVSLAAVKKLHRCVRLGMGLYLAAAVVGVALPALFLLLANPGGLYCTLTLLAQAVFVLIYWLYEKNMRL